MRGPEFLCHTPLTTRSIEQSFLLHTLSCGAGSGAGEDGQEALQQELQLLKAKVEAHPEVKRFAVENMHLGHELERLAALVDRNELATLNSDLDVLRDEMVLLAESADKALEEVRQATPASIDSD